MHLFRRQAEPVVPFGTVRFLRRAPVEHARRRRLREWLLLALRTLALVLLALSFARPYFVDTRAAQAGPVTVIAVDTSYSVSAPPQVERRARWPAGRSTEARRTAPWRSSRSTSAPRSWSRPRMDRGVVRAAIDRLAPGVQEHPVRRRGRSGGRLMAGRGGRLVVVSDLQQNGWSEASGTPCPPARRWRRWMSARRRATWPSCRSSGTRTG